MRDFNAILSDITNGMDVRNAKGEQVALVPGMWYVGANWMGNIEVTADGKVVKDYINTREYTQPEYGEIAQYVGYEEFYDEGQGDVLVRMQDYEYILEQNMGKL
jgi:hypothetical protein